MRPKWFVTVAGLAMVAACGGTSSSSPSGPRITISEFSFSPSTLSVKAGTTVTGTNNGSMTHTTATDTIVWRSATLSPTTGAGRYGGGNPDGRLQFHFTTTGI